MNKKWKNWLSAMLLGGAVVLSTLGAGRLEASAAAAVNVPTDGVTWVDQMVASKEKITYQIVVPSDGRVDLTWQSRREQGTRCQLWNSDETYTYWTTTVNSRDASEDSPKTNSASFYLRKGVYYFKAEDWSGSSKIESGRIRVQAKFTSGNTNEVEPNATFAQATPLAQGKKIHAMMSYQPDDRLDFYKIEVPADGGVCKFHTVTMYEETRMEVYDLNQVLLEAFVIHDRATEESPSTAEWELKDLKKGTYYLKFMDNWYMSKGDTCGYYDISWNWEAPEVKVSALALTPSALNLTVGGTAQLTATVFPADATNKTLQWASSDMGVVAVDQSGKLLAVDEGSAMITATTTDGTNLAKSCSVTVKAPAQTEPPKDDRPVVVPEVKAPGQVKGVTAAVSGRKPTSLKLSWKAVSGASGYRVYKYNSTSGEWKKYKDVKAKSVTVTGLSPEKKYSFKVAAYKTSGSEKKLGKKSGSYSAYTAPKVLKATAITSKKTVAKSSTRWTAQLKWKKVSGATGYKVYYKKTAGSSWTLLKKVKGTSLKVGVVKGKTNYFRVAAYRTKNGLTTLGKYSKSVSYKAK